MDNTTCIALQVQKGRRRNRIVSAAEYYHYCVTSYKHVRERKRGSRLGICCSACRPISSKTHNPLRRRPRALSLSTCLQASSAVLLVNVPVALLLHPVLEDHGDAENQDEVDTDDAECCGEDLVEVPVGEGGKWTNASTFLGCHEGVGAGRVLNKGRCGGVDVSAAVELVCMLASRTRCRSSLGAHLLLQQGLDLRCLTSPEHAQVPARLQRFYPDG